MGTVRKQRTKYSGPSHPWEAERLEEEKKLKAEYGFKNKKEIWKVNSLLRSFKRQAKLLIARRDEQARKEEVLLLKRMVKYGLVQENATLDTILGIDIRKLCERRLQSVVLTKGLARTSRQARQMIAHGHIAVEGQKINVPSYLVTLEEEAQITYAGVSPFTNNDHPELTIQKKEDKRKIDVVETKAPEAKPEEKKAEEVKEAPAEVKAPEVKQETVTPEQPEVAKNE